MNTVEFKKLLNIAKLSKKELSQNLSIPYPTVLSWGSTNKIPAWLESWLKNYIKAKSFDKIMEILKESF